MIINYLRHYICAHFFLLSNPSLTLNPTVSPSLSTSQVIPAVQLARNLNQLCVVRRVDRPPFPPGGVCYRGSGLPFVHHAFFTPGKSSLFFLTDTCVLSFSPPPPF